MPTATMPTILLIEDSPSLALTYEEYLRDEPYRVVTITTGKEAMSMLSAFKPSAVILDLHLPDMHDFQILQHIRKAYPKTPVIVITADTAPEIALQAMREGAFDFIAKPFSKARLVVTTHNALERVALEDEVLEWRQCLGSSPYQGFIGNAPSMLAVYRIIDSVASSKTSLFIMGETGTGKEIAARALHKASPRHQGPFIPVYCSSYSSAPDSSQRAGDVKESIQNAADDFEEKLSRADGGTLFLDDVSELTDDLQIRLLHFLQTSEIKSQDNASSKIVDVRIVSATNKDPHEEIRKGALREDLFYRLHIVPLEMPPLRDRDDDIFLLADHFFHKYAEEEGKNFLAFAPDVLKAIRHYDWPGNVRELENTIRSIIVLYNGPYVTKDMLPEVFFRKRASALPDVASPYPPIPKPQSPVSLSEIRPLWLVEKEAILQALEVTLNDVAKAAAFLEVSPSTLYRKLQAWKVDKKPNT